jgi:peptide/nickel transport system substrate-binding protein
MEDLSGLLEGAGSTGEGAQLDRRQLLAAAAGLVVTAAASRVPAAAAASRVTRKTKVARYAMSGAVTNGDTADPAFSSTQHDGRLMVAVYEQLTGYDQGLRATPWLAQSWEHNGKGTLWTFNLRKGVRFHDGSPLTAKDVVYTFRRLIDPNTKSPAASLLSFLTPSGITALNDHTVRFHLNRPIADLPGALITKSSYIVKHGATSAELARQTNGTGPFKLGHFTAGGTQTTFVRNPHYWHHGLPKSDVIQLISIPEPASRVAALKRGQVDVIEDPAGSDVPGLRGGNTRVVFQPKGNMEVIAMQMDQPPFDDVRVRQALKYAVDRQKMIQLVAQGNATVVNDIPIPSLLQYAVTGPARAHDIAKAKALLQQAGHGNGLTVKLSVSDVQARFVDFATAYQAMASEAGITVQLDVSPSDTYWDNVWLKAPMFVSAWIARPADAMLSLLFPSDAAWNETHWKKPQWDAQFAAAQRTLSTKKRGTMYQSLERQVIDQGGYIAPYMVKTIGATRSNVRGYEPSGTFFEGESFKTIEVR